MGTRKAVTRLLFLIGAVLLLTCDRGSIQGPSSPVEDTSVYISDVVAQRSEIATGGDATEITTVVRDDQDQLFEGEVVEFSEITDLGYITPRTDTTGSTGRASTTFTSRDVAGTASIQVTAGTDVDTITVTVSQVVASIDTSYTDAEEIYASSGFTQITTRVTDDSQTPITGATVTFTELTSLGTLNPATDSTNANGYAYAEFSAGSDTGTAKIRIATGGVSDTITVRILPPNYFISATASPENPLADGETQVQIEIQAEDDQLNPIPNLELRVTSNNSSILSSRRVTTDENGVAEIVVAAPASATDIPMEVYVGLSSLSGGESVAATKVRFSKLSPARTTSRERASDFTPDFSGKRSTQITKNRPQLLNSVISSHTESGRSEQAVASSRSDTLAIVFSGVQLAISSSRDTLLANESDLAEITVTALRADGNPIGNDYTVTVHGELGVFPNGQLSIGATPNVFGRVITTYTAGITPGEASIFASIGEVTSDVISIRLLGRSPARVELESDVSDVIGTDDNSVELTATVYDSTDTPLQNALVTFESPGVGTILQRSGVTDAAGQFTTSYIPGILGAADTTISITATASSNNNTVSGSFVGPEKSNKRSAAISKSRKSKESLQKSTATSNSFQSATDVHSLQASTNILVRGITLSTSTQTDNLIADGTSEAEINVQTVETTRGFPVEGIDVTLQVLENRGGIDRTVTTNESGVATATFIASINPGVARIYAEIGSGTVVDTSTALRLLDDAPKLIALSSPDQYLLADGNSTYEIQGTIIDSLDNPMPNRDVVLRRLNGVASVADSTLTSDSNGEFSTTLTAQPAGANSTERIAVRYDGTAYDTLNVSIRGVRLSATAADTMILGNGTDETQINVVLQELGQNTPLEDQTIRFSTTNGLITGTALTNAQGLATATLTSGLTDNTVRDTVIASLGTNFTDTTYVWFVDPSPVNLEISAAQQSMLGNGLASTQVTVALENAFGQPVANNSVNVDITTPSGTTTETLTTGGTGVAQMTLTSFATSSDDSVTITASIADAGAVARQLNANSSRPNTRKVRNADSRTLRRRTNTIGQDISQFYPGDALVRAIQALEDSLTIGVRGVNIVLSSDQSTLIADGEQTAALSAHITETTAGVPVSLGNVEFSTSRGFIEGSQLTNSSGRANVTFTAGSTPGDAVITARYGNVLTARDTVTLLASGPNSLALDAPSSILGDGVTTGSVTATVLDIHGDPIEGQSVTFTSEQDAAITSTATTDSDGEAVATLQSLSTASDITDSLTVSVGDLEQTSAVIYRGVELELSATNSTVLAGTALVTISGSVVETSNRNQVNELPINFSTTLGSVPSSVVSDSGSITFNFTPGNTSGTARIVGYRGPGIADTVFITVRGQTPKSISLDPTSTSILGDGVASLDIPVTLTDSLDNPMDGESVQFTTDLGTIQNGNTETVNGVATATLVAPVSSTDQTATVTVTHPASGMSDNVAITVRGIQLTVSSSRSTLPANSTSQSTISAQLREVTSNSVVPGKQISFSTNAGTITSTATGDSSGVARVQLTAGSSANASVQVQAQYRSGLAQSVTLEFTQPEPTYFDLTSSPTQVYVQGASGTHQSTITANIADNDSVPLQENLTLTFTASRGYLTSTQSPNNTTDNVQAAVSNGTAEVTFHSENETSAGGISVSITDGDFQYTEQVLSILGGDPDEIAISIGPREDLQNGFYRAPVSALVKDIFNNPASGDYSVFFTIDSTSAGSTEASIGASASADNNGVSTVNTVYSSSSAGDSIRVQAEIAGSDTTTKWLQLP